MWPSVIIGLLLGLITVPLSDVGLDAVREKYDSRNPVVVTNGTLLHREEDSVEVAIVGEKKRACIYVALAAYATGADGLMRDTYTLRVDMPSGGATRPVGPQSFGVWRLWPIPKGVTRIQMWSTHQCEGRLVRSLMAEIELGKTVQ